MAATASLPDPHRAPGFLTWVAELVHQHRAQLLSYVRRRGLGAEEALDVVQDTFASFLTLREAPSIARVGDDAIKLLTVIARHNVLNRKRKRARRETGFEAGERLAVHDAPSSEELLAQAEKVARVYGCMLRMNHVQRAVIMLSTLDERPHEDVAAILGIAPGHVRVLLHRARAHVRDCPFEQMPSVSALALRDSLRPS